MTSQPTHRRTRIGYAQPVLRESAAVTYRISADSTYCFADSVVATTTFENARKIMDELAENGIQELHLRMTGWSNGGVRQKVLTRTCAPARLQVNASRTTQQSAKYTTQQTRRGSHATSAKLEQRVKPQLTSRPRSARPPPRCDHGLRAGGSSPVTCECKCCEQTTMADIGMETMPRINS